MNSYSYATPAKPASQLMDPGSPAWLEGLAEGFRLGENCRKKFTSLVNNNRVGPPSITAAYIADLAKRAAAASIDANPRTLLGRREIEGRLRVALIGKGNSGRHGWAAGGKLSFEGDQVRGFRAILTKSSLTPKDRLEVRLAARFGLEGRVEELLNRLARVTLLVAKHPMEAA